MKNSVVYIKQCNDTLLGASGIINFCSTRFSFKTRFKIEFLLPLSGSRNDLEKPCPGVFLDLNLQGVVREESAFSRLLLVLEVWENITLKIVDVFSLKRLNKLIKWQFKLNKNNSLLFVSYLFAAISRQLRLKSERNKRSKMIDLAVNEIKMIDLKYLRTFLQ